jgi:hypothetical protein
MPAEKITSGNSSYFMKTYGLTPTFTADDGQFVRKCIVHICKGDRKPKLHVDEKIIPKAKFMGHITH